MGFSVKWKSTFLNAGKAFRAMRPHISGYPTVSRRHEKGSFAGWE